MRRINFRAHHTFSIVFAILLIAAQGLYGQDKVANEWFKQGLKEKDPEKKIEAYQKAIEQDGSFVQAHYNLGIVYKELKRYEDAERAFAAAKKYSIRAPRDLRFTITYELAQVKNRLKKSREFKKYLEEAYKLASDNNQRARIRIALARIYAAQENYEQALAEIEKGMKLKIPDKTHFENFRNILQKELQLQQSYQQALASIAQGNLVEAKMVLSKIAEERPTYKDITVKIAEIDSQLNQIAKRDIKESLFEQGVDYEKQGFLELALASYNQLAKRDPGYKDVQRRIETLQQQIEAKNLMLEKEKAYNNGLFAFRTGNWPQAIIAFEKVLKIDPGFKDVRKKLNEARAELEKESSIAIIARYYQEGLRSMQNGDLGNAMVAFEKVKRINPNYRNVNEMLQDIEFQLETTYSSSLRSPALARRSNSQVNLDSLYTEAQTFIDQQDWKQASLLLEKIVIINPEYKDAVDLLASTRTNMAYARGSEPETVTVKGGGMSKTVVAGALISIIVLPLIGFIVFSPEARARIHLLRGNQQAAARIYESLLEKNPGRLKLYPALANLYLIAGRTDQAAMKVYQTIVRLNLNVENREQIESLIKTNYLAEGGTGSEAIKAFEEALRAETGSSGSTEA